MTGPDEEPESELDRGESQFQGALWCATLSRKEAPIWGLSILLPSLLLVHMGTLRVLRPSIQNKKKRARALPAALIDQCAHMPSKRSRSEPPSGSSEGENRSSVRRSSRERAAVQRYVAGPAHGDSYSFETARFHIVQ